MNELQFSELLESVTEALAISKGKRETSRIFYVDPVDVKAIREKAVLSQNGLASMMGVRGYLKIRFR